MSKQGRSKLVAGGRRALVALGLERRPTPILVKLAGFALSAGAVLAVVPFAWNALDRLRLRAKPRSDEASRGNGTGANGTIDAAESARRAMEGLETDELGRAENEGMHPGRW